MLGRKASGLIWWFLLYRGSRSIAASWLMSLFAVRACFVCISFGLVSEATVLCYCVIGKLCCPRILQKSPRMANVDHGIVLSGHYLLLYSYKRPLQCKGWPEVALSFMK